MLPYLDAWEFGQLSVPQREEYLRLKEYEGKMLEFEALVAQNDRENTAGGRRDAEDYFNRYGKDAAMLRAGEIVALHGGSPEAIYALGFWRRTLELAGFTPEEIESSRE